MFVKSNNSNKPKMIYALHAEQYDPDVFNRSPRMHAHVRQRRSTVAREKLTTLVSGPLYDRIAVCVVINITYLHFFKTLTMESTNDFSCAGTKDKGAPIQFNCLLAL